MVANEGGCFGTSLELDQADTPHISYVAGDSIRYAHWTQNGWDMQTVGCGYNTTLALDNTGHPVIAYQTHFGCYGTYDAVRYTWYDGQNWYDEMAFTGARCTGCILPAGNLSLTLSSSGDPHIVFGGYMYEGAVTHDEVVVFAARTAGVWNSGWVYGSGPTASAWDSMGRLHVAYSKGGGALGYMRRVGVNWEYARIEFPTSYLTDVALAVDSRDDPRISVFTADYATGSTLQYAAWRDGVWATELVESANYVGRHNSLALDRNGSPYIAYFDETAKALKLAASVGDSWTPRSSISDVGITGGVALALEGGGAMHIAYLDNRPIIDDTGWWVRQYDTSAIHVLAGPGASISYTIESGAANPVHPECYYLSWLSCAPIASISLALDAIGEHRTPAIGSMDGCIMPPGQTTPGLLRWRISRLMSASTQRWHWIAAACPTSAITICPTRR